MLRSGKLKGHKPFLDAPAKSAVEVALSPDGARLLARSSLLEASQPIGGPRRDLPIGEEAWEADLLRPACTSQASNAWPTLSWCCSASRGSKGGAAAVEAGSLIFTRLASPGANVRKGRETVTPITVRRPPNAG